MSPPECLNVVKGALVGTDPLDHQVSRLPCRLPPAPLQYMPLLVTIRAAHMCALSGSYPCGFGVRNACPNRTQCTVVLLFCAGRPRGSGTHNLTCLAAVLICGLPLSESSCSARWPSYRRWTRLFAPLHSNCVCARLQDNAALVCRC